MVKPRMDGRTVTLVGAVSLLEIVAKDLDYTSDQLDRLRRQTDDEVTAEELAHASSLAAQGWAHAVGAARTLKELLKTEEQKR